MRRFVRRPSPAMVVALVALFAAFSGLAVAGPSIPGVGRVHSEDIHNGHVRTQDIRNNGVRGLDIRTGTVNGSDVGDDSLTGADILESSLGPVPSATSATNAQNATNATNAQNANTVGGRSAAQLRTLSGFSESPFVIDLTATLEDVTPDVSITTATVSEIMATGSAELQGDNGTGTCRMLIDGVSSVFYEYATDDVGAGNATVDGLTFARTLPPGTHTVEFQCNESSGNISKDDGAVSVMAVPQ
jgi:hypothetical protein